MHVFFAAAVCWLDSHSLSNTPARRRADRFRRMSRPLYPSKHIFCTATGVEVTDESLTVADYLQLEVSHPTLVKACLGGRV